MAVRGGGVHDERWERWRTPFPTDGHGRAHMRMCGSRPILSWCTSLFDRETPLRPDHETTVRRAQVRSRLAAGHRRRRRAAALTAASPVRDLRARGEREAQSDPGPRAVRALAAAAMAAEPHIRLPWRQFHDPRWSRRSGSGGRVHSCQRRLSANRPCGAAHPDRARLIGPRRCAQAQAVLKAAPSGTMPALT
jgi:hypothetical protein